MHAEYFKRKHFSGQSSLNWVTPGQISRSLGASLHRSHIAREESFPTDWTETVYQFLHGVVQYYSRTAWLAGFLRRLSPTFPLGRNASQTFPESRNPRRSSGPRQRACPELYEGSFTLVYKPLSGWAVFDRNIKVLKDHNFYDEKRAPSYSFIKGLERKITTNERKVRCLGISFGIFSGESPQSSDGERHPLSGTSIPWAVSKATIWLVNSIRRWGTELDTSDSYANGV